MRSKDPYISPYNYLRNCPIDSNVPFLGFKDPVTAKRNKKTTFVSEGFLGLYAIMLAQKPIGYVNVNNGDIFQDIHPMEKLQSTQSQKALENIYFHKDLANHFVRPDWVNICGVRNDTRNRVYTSFTRNKDVLDFLDADTKKVLSQEQFFTPFDGVAGF